MSKKAFALIEAMVAAAILAAGAAAAFGSYYTMLGVAAHQRHLSEARHVVQTKLEQLLVAEMSSPLLFALPAAKSLVFTGAVTPLGRPTKSANGPSVYRVSWKVTRGEPIDGYLLVQVAASWIERGRERSTSVQRYRPEVL